MITQKEKLTLFYYLLIFSLAIYISGFFALFSLAFSLAFYSVVAYFFFALYKKFTDSSFQIFGLVNYNDFFRAFIYRIGSILVLFIVILGGFSLYENELVPARMPVYEISNGQKTVVFQSMSHIATPAFYQQVKAHIATLKQNGYTLYFEGVRPGNEQNQIKFAQALGVKMDQNTYKYMSQLYGLVNQDNRIFLGLINNKDVNVDVGIDDIMRDYEKIKATETFSVKEYENPVDISQDLLKELSKLRPNELQVLRYVNRSFINIILKSDDLQSAIQSEFANQALFQVILDNRNKVVAQKILTSDDKKIVATYGMLHFKGIFQILQQNDPKWQIKRIDYLYPLK